MSRYLGSLVLLAAVVACGGSTDIWEDSGGGSSPGGSSPGGSSPGGNSPGGKESGGSSSGGAAGKGTGGTTSNGGTPPGGASHGGTGVGGTIASGGNAGTAGGGFVDPRCPDRQPTGACLEDATLACQYDLSGCLCYPHPSFGVCNKVDPSCPGAASAPPPPDAAGIGGFSTKIALPPKMTCRCTAETWACTYGP